jgi:tripartite-type tricarboxylate transporter receptor subunit TctC
VTVSTHPVFHRFVVKESIMRLSNLMPSLLTLGLAWLAPAAYAQGAYPNKPVRMIVPFPAGQATDMVARMLAEGLGRTWGQQVVVENRPGVPGMMVGKEAPADGYTLTFGTSGTLAVNPAVIAKISYDTQRDYTMIHGGAIIPMVIVASANSPFQSLKDLVDAARKEPGKLNIGYGGVNNTQHLTGELFKSYAKVDLVGVNYKGSAAAVTDLLGGQVTLLVDSLAATVPHIKSGKIRPLAISTLQRVPQMPDLPTVAETFPGFEGVGWAGLVAPKGTPQAIVDKISDDTLKVLSDPKMRELIIDRGMVPDLRGAREWGDFVNAEVLKWVEAARKAGLKPE